MKMRDLGLEKNQRVVKKIIHAICKFYVSLVKLKTKQNRLSTKDFDGNCYYHHKENLNNLLHSEKSKNLVLIELQRQRAT